MRDWPGLILNKRPVGDGFLVLDNVDFDTDGEVNRRRGLGVYLATTPSFNRMKQYHTANNVIAVQTGTTSAIAPKVSIVGAGSGTVTNFSDLSSAVVGGTLATTASAAYWSDGTNAMRAFYSTTSIDAGIAAPSSAPSTSLQAGGSATAGTHLVRYRYYDSTRKRYSDPSPAATVVVLGQVTATGYATTNGDAVTGVVLVNAGQGYTGNVSISFGGPGAGAAATGWYSSARADGGLVSTQVTAGGTGFTSPPTVSFPAPSTPPQTIRVPVVALANSTVDKIVVEVSLADGSEFYQAAVVSNSTANVDVTMSDATLAVQVAATDYTEDGYGHAQPPKGTICGVHNGRMFVWGATTEAADTLYWSRLGFVESFKPAEWSRRIFGAVPDSPRAMFSLSDDLYLVGARSMYRLIYTGDPGTGLLVPLPTTNGAWNQDCVVEAEGAFFGFGASGVWVVSSLQPVEMSQVVRPFFSSEIDMSRGTESFGWWDPIIRTINFCFYNLSGVRRVMTWWLDQKVWSTATYKQRIGAACTVTWTDSDVEPMVAGQTCVYRSTDVKTDGGGTESSGTVLSYVAPTLTTNAPHGLKPYQWVYFPRADVWAEVTATPTSATATIGTVSGVLAGDTVQYGPIETTVGSEWGARETLERDRASYIRVEAAEKETLAELQVKFYADWSATPTAFTYEVSATAPSGVTYDSANTRFLVDLNASNGMSLVPIPAEFSRVVRYQVKCIDSANGLHLMDAAFHKSKRGAE